MTLPLVTIGIPTYNRPEGLSKALTSAVTQTYGNVEIIVSDNATPNGLQPLEAGYPNGHILHIHRQPENVGAEANFRYVLEQATGEYFMWLADDDWIEPNYVAECVAYLQQWRGFALVAGASTLGDSTTIEHARAGGRLLEYYAGVGENSAFYGIARRSLWLGLTEHTGLGADWHMMAEIAFNGMIQTLKTTAIHRAPDGASSSLPANAHRQIARDAFRHTYRLGGLRLAARVYLILYARWCMFDAKQPSIPRRIELKLHRWALAWMSRPLSRWRRLSIEMKGSG
jgi:glycosyltransferase involved in cell wall biosynthesis